MIRSGELTRRITLESPPPTDDTSGGKTGAWTEEYSTWAAIETVTVDDDAFGGGFASTSGMRFRIRWRKTRPSIDWRILYDGRYFYVRGIEDPGEQREEYRIVATEGR